LKDLQDLINNASISMGDKNAEDTTSNKSLPVFLSEFSSSTIVSTLLIITMFVDATRFIIS